MQNVSDGGNDPIEEMLDGNQDDSQIDGGDDTGLGPDDGNDELDQLEEELEAVEDGGEPDDNTDGDGADMDPLGA